LTFDLFLYFLLVFEKKFKMKEKAKAANEYLLVFFMLKENG